MLTYRQAIEYLESFIDYEKIAGPYNTKKWKLERVENLLKMIDNPHLGMKFVHIAGTKGKGSTAVMTASILKESGFRVGLYISPHLVSFRERIRIDDEMISEDQVVDMVSRIKPYTDELKKREDDLGDISFFDVYTALAFLFFKMQKTDIVVLEVGMGGRLDATNVVTPLVSVITQISYDHMQSLGNTIDAIAGEKAGIIKDTGYVITSPQVPPALEVIKSKCLEKSARLFEVCKDICFQKITVNQPGYSLFNVSGIFNNKYENLRIPLMGDHQLVNATTSIGTIEILRFYGINVSLESIRNGLEKVKWHARIEVIQKDPIVILDVAHNEASAKALRDTIEANFSYNKLILVLGISLHKDIKGMGKHLCPIADKVILTKVNNPRAMSPEYMKSELADFCSEPIITTDVRSALEEARTIVGKRDLICITGSVYLAGEVMQIFNL